MYLLEQFHNYANTKHNTHLNDIYRDTDNTIFDLVIACYLIFTLRTVYEKGYFQTPPTLVDDLCWTNLGDLSQTKLSNGESLSDFRKRGHTRSHSLLEYMFNNNSET
jgi:hypothetical protein